MMALVSRHKAASLVAAFIALVVLVMSSWMIVAGPTTVLRVLRHGDTDILDFSHYPGRELVPGEKPYRFPVAGASLQVPGVVLEKFQAGSDLESIAAANNTIALLIIHNDAIVFERYFQDHDSSSLSQGFSVTKSLFSILVGMAIDDGVLRGVDQPITDFVPELAGRGFADVTLHHLLTMQSGASYVENDNPFGEHVIMNYTPDLESEILEFEIEDRPGLAFRYKSGDNALLALALDRALGEETITAYMQRRIWKPLGMQHKGIWTTDRDGGLEKTWCCLAASAADFAKFGRLLLNNGVWNGDQIVSAEWVSSSTKINQVPASAWPARYRAAGWRGYAYQWWLASESDGDYFAMGKDGQYLYINPRRNTIIVRLGWSSGDLYSDEWIRLFQAIATELTQHEHDPRQNGSEDRQLLSSSGIRKRNGQ